MRGASAAETLALAYDTCRLGPDEPPLTLVPLPLGGVITLTEHLNGFKIAMLPDVREHCEGFPVELWLRSGRLVVRCSNECGNNYTDLDLGDLLDWAGSGDLRYLQEEKNVGDGTPDST